MIIGSQGGPTVVRILSLPVPGVVPNPKDGYSRSGMLSGFSSLKKK